MTVQYLPDPITFEGDDFVRTDRGITWGIKCRVIANMGVPQVMIFTKSAGVWVWSENIDISVDTSVRTVADISQWWNEVFLVKLNAWLKKTFPAIEPGDDPWIPESPSEDVITEIHRRINAYLKITVNADGTLEAK